MGCNRLFFRTILRGLCGTADGQRELVRQRSRRRSTCQLRFDCGEKLEENSKSRNQVNK